MTRLRRVPPGTSATPVLKAAMDAWQEVVLAMGAVSDAATETVRLRAAAHHDCRT